MKSRFKRLLISLKGKLFKKKGRVLWVCFPCECTNDQEKVDILYRTAAFMNNNIVINKQ